jgi:hypothetical protein
MKNSAANVKLDVDPHSHGCIFETTEPNMMGICYKHYKEQKAIKRAKATKFWPLALFRWYKIYKSQKIVNPFKKAWLHQLKSGTKKKFNDSNNQN